MLKTSLNWKKNYSEKNFSRKFLKTHKEILVLYSFLNNVTCIQVVRFATLLKRDSGTDVHLWILQAFSKHLVTERLRDTAYFIYKRQDIFNYIYYKTLSYVLFKHFIKEWEQAIGRYSFNQNHWNLPMKKLILNEDAGYQALSLLKKPFHSCFLMYFAFIFSGSGFEIAQTFFLSKNINDN